MDSDDDPTPPTPPASLQPGESFETANEDSEDEAGAPPSPSPPPTKSSPPTPPPTLSSESKEESAPPRPALTHDQPMKGRSRSPPPHAHSAPTTSQLLKGGSRSKSPHRRQGAPVAYSNASILDDEDLADEDLGFSPDALLDRYSAEIEKDQVAAAAASANTMDTEAVPPPFTMTNQSSTFWGLTKNDSESSLVEQTETAARAKHATRSVSPMTRARAARGRSPGPPSKTPIGPTGSSDEDLDVKGRLGHPAQPLRKNQPNTTGGVFDQKERFEYVDQSVNLMDHSNSSGPASSRRRKPRNTTGRYGDSKGGFLRTLSKDMTEIVLGQSTRRLERTKTAQSQGKEVDINAMILEEDDEEWEDRKISTLAYCLCFFLACFVVILILVLIGVATAPVGFPSMKSGENAGSEHDTNVPLPKSLRSAPLWKARWDNLQSMIIGARLSSREELEDSTSLPYKALQWLSDIDKAQVGRIAKDDTVHHDAEDYEILERYALAMFFYSTHQHNEDDTAMFGGDSNDETLQAALLNSEAMYTMDQDTQQASSSSSSPLNQQQPDWRHRTEWMTERHVCEWYGVQCHRSGRVSALQLKQNFLSGYIPGQLRALSEMQHLDLSHNNLRQQMPEVLWDAATWPDLQTVDLSYNSLTGKLPQTIGFFSKLENMTLAGNQFTGEIPRSIADMTSLALLSLQGNNFTGSIIDTSPIANLRVLRLGQNKLKGTFPFSLTHNRNLIELRLDQNSLSGTLPPELDSLHKLEVLDIGSNSFLGPIPDVFSRLHHLQILEMENNRFGQHLEEEKQRAHLPTSFGALSDLRVLKINSNRFHGSIPQDWWGLKRLETLHLFNNDFSGTIPDGIGDFSDLKDFQIQDTFMTGTIPTQLGNCQYLDTFTVYNCRIEGRMPDEICNLHKLSDATTSGSNVTTSGGATPVLTRNAEQQRAHEQHDKKKLQLLAADCWSAVECSCCDRCY